MVSVHPTKLVILSDTSFIISVVGCECVEEGVAAVQGWMRMAFFLQFRSSFNLINIMIINKYFNQEECVPPFLSGYRSLFLVKRVFPLRFLVDVVNIVRHLRSRVDAPVPAVR